MRNPMEAALTDLMLKRFSWCFDQRRSAVQVRLPNRGAGQSGGPRQVVG